MTKRKGLGLNLGRGYKNLVLRDPIVHSQSSKGLSQVSAKPLFANIGAFAKQESRFVQRYLTFKSEEKSPLIRNVRLNQLQNKEKFLETALKRKFLDVKKHTMYDYILANKESIVIKNKYGSRKINIQATAEEKKRKYKQYKGYTYAEGHRVDKKSGYWKILRKQLKGELADTRQEINLIRQFNEPKQKKKDETPKISFDEAMKMTPLGRMLNSGQGGL